MPTEVIMPQMGESIVEGAITKWLKKPGDAVRKDEPLFEISTDKVDAEIPSPADGFLSEVRAQEGDTVAINAVVAVLVDSAAEVKAAPAPATEAAGEEGAAPMEFSSVSTTLSPVDPNRRLRSSPLVRRMAKEHGLDLRVIPGTGSEGRITKEDMLAYLALTPAQRAALAPGSAPAAPQYKEGELVPMTKMRSIIARRMHESVTEIPHVYMVYKIDMTRIARLRERERKSFEQRHGVKLTYMPFIAKAAVGALRKHPIVNSTVEGESIRYRLSVNLGIAVALDWGLLVPVIKQAENKSIAELARAIVDLAGRARTKKLMPDEAQGSTFTLTNSGVWGGECGTPIINQPDSAILGIGGLRKEPVVLTDADGQDTIAIRSMQQFCLGFDHRSIDGADAGKFMQEFQQKLENWDEPIG
jgi:pyruvate dehydrogenase E2 component (dihydrolipoamide acetyltransferase)